MNYTCPSSTNIIILPLRGVRGIAMSVSVCLSVCPLAHLKPHQVHVQTSWNFLCMLNVAAAQSCSNDKAICHVLLPLLGGRWRWALVSPDGVAPSRMLGVSASVSLPLHHKVQKFASGTGSPGWSRKKGRKMVVVLPLLMTSRLRPLKWLVKIQ